MASRTCEHAMGAPGEVVIYSNGFAWAVNAAPFSFFVPTVIGGGTYRDLDRAARADPQFEQLPNFS